MSDIASARILLYQLGDLPLGISHELRDKLLSDLEAANISPTSRPAATPDQGE